MRRLKGLQAELDKVRKQLFDFEMGLQLAARKLGVENNYRWMSYIGTYSSWPENSFHADFFVSDLKTENALKVKEADDKIALGRLTPPKKEKSKNV